MLATPTSIDISPTVSPTVSTFNYIYRCDLKCNDVHCRKTQLPVVCVRLRQLRVAPVSRAIFTPEFWATKNHDRSHCSTFSAWAPAGTYAKYMRPDSPNHVPGGAQCQDFFLRLETDGAQALASATSKIGEENCLYFPPRGYTCVNWKSPYLKSDLAAARRRVVKPISMPYNTTFIGTTSSLAIWSSAMASEPHPEMISLAILQPCVGEYSYALTTFLDKIDRSCDSCILLHFSQFLAECGLLLPLTPFRIALVRGFFIHYQRRFQSTKALEVSNNLLERFLSSVPIVDPAIENRKMSIALSLVLSQLRHFDNDWRVADQKAKSK